MTQDQRCGVIEKLAYNISEIYKHYGIQSTDEKNWIKAEEVLKSDQRINGEDFLLGMLKNE